MLPYPPLDLTAIDSLLQQALAEDIGRGDITSNLTIDPKQPARFVIAARSPLILCGLPLAKRVFELIGSDLTLQPHATDGQPVEAGAVLLSGSGPALTILAAERTALNLLQHLCGIATLTHRYVKEVEGTKAVILDSRKTLPGLRGLQKYAVRTGGGRNHRLRLDDGILIKDNHISLCGGIVQAVAKARAGAPLLTMIEVECDTLAQLEEALKAKADVVMLDNMSLDQLREAVRIAGGKVPLEASGNVSLNNVREIAETGVDFISIGKLTHSAPANDIGLDIVV